MPSESQTQTSECKRQITGLCENCPQKRVWICDLLFSWPKPTVLFFDNKAYVDWPVLFKKIGVLEEDEELEKIDIIEVIISILIKVGVLSTERQGNYCIVDDRGNPYYPFHHGRKLYFTAENDASAYVEVFMFFLKPCHQLGPQKVGSDIIP